MSTKIADALYGLVFPGERIYWYSWPLWRRLPGPLVDWIIDHWTLRPL